MLKVPVGKVGPKVTTWRGMIWPRDSAGWERERTKSQEREAGRAGA
jgi:hypothetical protein